MQILPILVAAVILIAAALAFSVGLKNMRNRKSRTSSTEGRDRNSILKEANRKLSANPKDPNALRVLADLYYSEGEYKKALHSYKLLLDQPDQTNKDTGELHLRYGLAAIQCEAWTEAYEALVKANEKMPNNFEVMAALGRLEYMRKNYNKAAVLFKKTLLIRPDHHEAAKYFGQCLFRMNRYSDAVNQLKKVVAVNSSDLESLYMLGRSYYEIPLYDSALKALSHLRSVPRWGAGSSFYTGMICAKKREWEEAITNYQMGLKHEKIEEGLEVELKYNLACALIQKHQIDQALALFNELNTHVPGYKDVNLQVEKYKELDSNRNFKTYLLAPASEFVSLCRKIIEIQFPKAKIKVTGMDTQNMEYVDLIAAVKTSKWEDLILFRFMRTEGLVGELLVRELYSHLKEVHAGRGFCYVPGQFSSEAVDFVDARLIDLVAKPDLMKMLKMIRDSSTEQSK